MDIRRTHLIDEDGVTELTIVLFSDEELGLPDEDDPEPEGLDVFRPDYEVYQN
jgi:hypothetical protein